MIRILISLLFMFISYNAAALVVNEVDGPGKDMYPPVSNGTIAITFGPRVDNWYRIGTVKSGQALKIKIIIPPGITRASARSESGLWRDTRAGISARNIPYCPDPAYRPPEPLCYDDSIPYSDDYIYPTEFGLSGSFGDFRLPEITKTEQPGYIWIVNNNDFDIYLAYITLGFIIEDPDLYNAWLNDPNSGGDGGDGGSGDGKITTIVGIALWGIIGAITVGSERIISAWAVKTKQTAVAAHQESLSTLNSNKALAAAVGSIRMSQRVAETQIAFSPGFGQPDSNNCIAQREKNSQTEAIQQAKRDQHKLLANYVGARIGSRSDAENERRAIHRKQYCSISEARQGMCKLKANGMQAWDSDYSAFSSQMTMPPESEFASYDYIQMVTDARAIAAADCETASCGAALGKQMPMQAVMSMAASALVAQVTARRVPVLTHGEGTGK